MRWLRRRWPRVALVGCWLVDVTVALGTRWQPGAVVTNGVWDWSALVVYHGALWTIVACLLLVEER